MMTISTKGKRGKVRIMKMMVVWPYSNSANQIFKFSMV
jgi:hypothetical protein